MENVNWEKWTKLFTEKRIGTDTQVDDSRSEYQRDFDRLIFNSGFRRLQNKTQVFPLPGVAFVHNRLTHSLEVASVGRSLGRIIGSRIAKLYETKFPYEAKNFYQHELSNVIAAACLAHDIGNPPFGHSGEKAISKFFEDNEALVIEKEKKLKDYFRGVEWDELLNFEGNANSLRYLTHSFTGKIKGGIRLTYTTLASILKYPCSVTGIDEKVKHKKKFNFFQNEKDIYKDICEKTNMQSEGPGLLSYKRHPFVYLTEAADDICYKMIDIEDAHRLGIVQTEEVVNLFLNLIYCLKVHKFEKVQSNTSDIKDPNEKVSYLRAKCINALTVVCADRFMENEPEIIEGTFDDELMNIVSKKCSEMKAITDLTETKIYNHPKVVKLELLGYQILYDLLELFIPAILKEKLTHKDKKLIQVIPRQFMHDYTIEYNKTTKEYRIIYKNGTDVGSYQKVFFVLDFLSGMTDEFALRLYKELKGIEISSHD